MSERIEVVSATRLAEGEFLERAPLGQSIRQIGNDDRFRWRIFPSNTAGLPTLYNSRIEGTGEADILAFVHDDVWLDDVFLADRLEEALAHFNVVGVAGNAARHPGQTIWCDLVNRRDEARGAIADKLNLRPHISRFGPSPAACELLDGVFLSARRSVLVKHGLRFDDRFAFHFYDLDFSRAARAAGLTVGVWPISLTHKGGGNGYKSEGWLTMRDVYLAKWQD